LHPLQVLKQEAQLPTAEIPERDIAIQLSRLTPPTEGFPWKDLRKILHDGQRMVKVQNGVAQEILPKVSTICVGRTDVTDDRRICDSKDPNV